MAKESSAEKTGIHTVDVEELIGLIRQVRPGLIGKLPGKRAARIVSAALTQIRRQLGLVEEGAVRVPGLGRFTIRSLQRDVKGKKRSVRRTTFKAVAPKPKRAPAQP